MKVNITVADHTKRITDEIERRTVRALNAAAFAGVRAGDQAANRPKPVTRFRIISARRVFGGFASGLKGGPLINIFDKGTLAEHRGPLKRPRKPSWQVNRGTNPYTARRRELKAGAGITPRNINAAIRKASRDALVRGIRGH